MQLTRIFNADVGQDSIGNAGPDAIEQDLDNLYQNKVWKDEVLLLNNITPYTPTQDYHPMTKKFMESYATETLMKKSIYDSTGNGIVDNAEKVNGHTVETNVPANATFTDTQTASEVPIVDVGEHFIAENVEVALQEIASRVDTIIATPIEGVSAQEIIDARQGNLSLGANLTVIKQLIVWKALDYKLESDTPSEYPDLQTTIFVATELWQSVGNVIIKTEKYNDNVAIQYLQPNGSLSMPIMYRLAVPNMNAWSTWIKIVTTKQPTLKNAVLQNGWSGTLQYRINTLGQLELRGELSNGVETAGTIIAIIDVAPAINKAFTVIGMNDSVIPGAFICCTDSAIRISDKYVAGQQGDIFINEIMNC